MNEKRPFQERMVTDEERTRLLEMARYVHGHYPEIRERAVQEIESTELGRETSSTAIEGSNL